MSERKLFRKTQDTVGHLVMHALYKYWNTTKVKGLESEWDTKTIEVNLCLVDVEFYNLTSDDLCIEGNLQIIDSQSYCHELVWKKIPEKYIYFESIGTWVTPHARKRGIVAFPPLKKGVTISKIVFKSECEINKNLEKKHQGFIVGTYEQQYLEVELIKNLESNSKPK